VLFNWHIEKAEITWMGVSPNHRRSGIGKALLGGLRDALPHGVEYILVSTLGDAVAYEPYDGTRKFYRKHGFVDFQRIPHPENPECEEELILRLSLKKSSSSAPAVGRRQPPVLRTQRLVVRMAEQSDVLAILQYYKENEARFANTDPPKPVGFYTEAFWSDAIQKRNQAWANEQSLNLLVFEPSGRVAGTIGFSQMFRGPFHACYLGYALGGASEGKGYITEALEASIRYVFEELNFHRIMANHLLDNERSAKVLRRLGFAVEGTALNYLFINGQWRDHVLNSLTNPNWKNPNP
ncbi:MAG: GNAT family N-acetyltransferase, partial [Bdellovibrionota bacterium]